MTTEQSPTVKEDGLHSVELPTVLAIPHERAKVQSSGWHDWLVNHSKFRFKTPSGSFTAYKSDKGYWTAQRRVDRKLRHQYLGESHTLTYETLDETARILDSPDYWHKHVSDKGRPREADKELRRESHKEYETNLSHEEITILREEVQRLKQRNSYLENENRRLEKVGADYSQDTFNALREKHQKALADATHWQEVAESYRKQAEKLRAQAERNDETPDQDPGAILNRLRKERKKSKADLKDVELIIELSQAIAF